MNKEKFFPATAMPDPDWWQALWPDPLNVLETVGIRAGMTAIDLCCGDGLFTVPMCRLLNGHVTAVDLDPKMLALAKKAVTGSGVPSPVWIQGDAREMAGHIRQQADVVFIANTFHGVPDQTGLAQSVFQVLANGGRFIIVNWHVRPREETPVLGQPRGPKPELRMSPDDVIKAVEPCGFELDETVELAPYHYGVIFKKK